MIICTLRVKFEFDHIVILQDKLNTYLWYIESKQYADIYPDKQFDNFCKKYSFLFLKKWKIKIIFLCLK